MRRATGRLLPSFLLLVVVPGIARSAEPYAADASRIVATREGPTETIFLMDQTWLGEPRYQRLVTNGFSMSATDLAGARYMRYFVYLPMLLHQSPLRRVLVISYGVGRTAGAATDLAPGFLSNRWTSHRGLQPRPHRHRTAPVARQPWREHRPYDGR